MPVSIYTTIEEGNPVWNDLTLTNYPWYLDGRQSTLDEGSIDPLTGNPQFKVNVNFEDRTRLTESKDYIVWANDVNALQEAIIGMQRVIGVVPFGSRGADDISARIELIEDFIVMDRSIDVDGHANLDERYMWGGAWPTNPLNATEYAAPISIKTHRHDGTYQGASKISLYSEVTGLLGKANIDLTSGEASMVTAADIYMTTAKTQTINTALANKFDKSGGTITGEVNILGNFRSLTMAEIDAVATTKVVGADVTDINSYSGYARQGLSSNGTGVLSSLSIPFRYGKYVAAIRVKVASNVSNASVASILISDGTTTHVTDSIVPSALKSTDYEMIYIEFEHKNRSGTSGKKNLSVVINFYSGITHLSIDSIVIQPVTTALYDDDSFLI